LRILLGHGSGSFGHFAAKDYGTRERVTNSAEWQGFQKVWNAARALNQIIVEEFGHAGLPVISLPASASVFTENRKNRRMEYKAYSIRVGKWADAHHFWRRHI
jgi:Predicted archaeal kinase